MHELTIIDNMMRKIESVAQEQGARRVVAVKVRLGALSHISAGHLREHFTHAAQGTLAQDARLDIEILTDANDPLAQEVVLDSIEVEETST